MPQANGDSTPPLGTLLLKEGIITQPKLKEAMRWLRAGTLKPDQVFVQLRVCTENQLAKLISRALDVKKVVPESIRPDPEYLVQITATFAAENALLPIQLQNDQLIMAMADPSDTQLIADVEAMTGFQIQPLVAPRSLLQEAISKAYSTARSQVADAETMRQELKAQIDEAEQAERLCRSFSVLSNKGGVGKTHSSINIGYTLARSGFRTLVIDADMGNADISNKLRLFPMRSLVDFLDKKAELDEIVMETPFGFDIIPGKTGEVRLANLKYFQRLRFMKGFARMSPQYDYIIYDLSAGVTLQVLDFALCAEDMIIVTTPRDVISSYACAKLTFLRHVALETRFARQDKNYEVRSIFRPWILLNQSEDREESERIFQTITQTAQQFAHSENIVQKLGFQFIPRPLGAVPRDPYGYVNAERAHQPYCTLYPHSPNVQSYRNIAYTLALAGSASPSGGGKSNLQRVAQIVAGGEK
jgi:flagellar biosynthesis protein FlhG